MARILAVDDEPEVLEILADMLQGDGHEVDITGSGQEALDRLAEGAYDLVVSDVHMPRISGLRLFEAIAAAHPRLARRFLLITGSALTPEVQTFVEQTGVRVLQKPFDFARTRQAVRAILEA